MVECGSGRLLYLIITKDLLQVHYIRGKGLLPRLCKGEYSFDRILTRYSQDFFDDAHQVVVRVIFSGFTVILLMFYL
jgi:hypothetical protein